MVPKKYKFVFNYSRKKRKIKMKFISFSIKIPAEDKQRTSFPTVETANPLP